MILFAFIVALTASSVYSDDQGDIDYQRILRAQLLRVNYDKRVAPKKNESGNVQVQISYISIMGLDLDTKTTMFTLNAGFFITWNDDYLTWEPRSFGYLNNTIFGCDEIWKPSIGAYDAGFGSAMANSFDKQRLRVYSNGKVQWEPRAIFKTRCHVDLTDYPYDSQMCYVLFTENDDPRLVNISLRHKGRWCRNSNPTWDCTNLTTVVEYNTDIDYGHSLITLQFNLKRKEGYYRYVIVYPYIAASLLAICIFLVPLSSKLRYLFAFWAVFILICELVFIGFELGLGTFGAPYAVRCISMNILSICCLLMVSTFIYAFIHGDSLFAPPDLLVTLIGSYISRLVFRLNSETIENNVEISSDAGKKKVFLSDWLLIASFVDRICFVVYIILLFSYHT